MKSFGYQLAQQLSIRLPTACAFQLAERVADVQWRISARDRAAVRANLALVLGEPQAGSASLVREVFRNFGRYLVEFFSIHQVPQPQLRVDGGEHLAHAKRAGRGAIILTAHLGNWEAGAILMRRLGFPMAAVALPHQEPGMDALFNAQRRRCGIDVIPLGPGASRQSLAVLREGRFVGLLGDRDFTGRSLRLRLCGRSVELPRGPAVLSLRAHAPIIPTFLLREGMWKFRLAIEAPLWPPARLRPDQSAADVMSRFAAVLEGYLTRFATQWLMFQPIADATAS